MPKPSFTLETNASESVLQVQGDLNVQHARDVKQFFQLTAEGVAHDVHLDLQNVTAFDVSAAQLTYRLRTEVQRQGHQFKITLPNDASLCDLLEKCGITKLLS